MRLFACDLATEGGTAEILAIDAARSDMSIHTSLGHAQRPNTKRRVSKYSNARVGSCFLQFANGRGPAKDAH